MATTFKPHLNNVSTTVAQPYTAGSGAMFVASGTSPAFGGTFPVIFTVITASSYGTTAETYTIYQATGRTGDQFTGLSALEGTTDRAYAIGDRVEVRWTDGLAKTIESAVNTIENAYATDTLVVHLAGTETISGAKTFSSTTTMNGNLNVVGAAIITGNGSGLTNLNASNLATGTAAAARLGTATPSNTTWLRGDSTWASNFAPNSQTGATYTILPTDTFLLCGPTGTMNVTLPSATASIAGTEFVILNYSTQTVNINRSGTDIIQPGNLTTYTFPSNSPGKFLRLMSYTGQFWIVGSN
jgi:hypothetical protein